MRLPSVLLALALSAPAAAQELLLNGSFERPPVEPGTALDTAPLPGRTSSIVGWVSPTDRITVADSFDGAVAAEGEQFANLDSSTSLRQDVFTVAGAAYTLRFALTAQPSETTTREVRVALGSTVVDVLDVPPSAAVWTYHAYTLTGTGCLEALVFEDVTATASTHGAFLDDVSLTGEGPPGTGAVLGFDKVIKNRRARLLLRAQDQFSRDLANLGDVDGNGVVDLAAGAQGDDDSGSNSGAVWVLLMEADGSVGSAVEITEGRGGFTGDLDADDFFGHTVAGIGDLDGDGVPDLAVGAKGDDDAGTNAGALYVLFLDTAGQVRAHVKTTGDSSSAFDLVPTNGEFGSAVEVLGDVDGDGIQDLGVGRRTYSDTGLVYTCFMNRDGTVRTATSITFGRNGLDAPLTPVTWRRDFGACIGALDDLDLDGVPDMIVGYPHSHHLYGGAYVLFLNPDGTCKAWTVLDYTTVPTLEDLLVHSDFKTIAGEDYARQSRNFAYGLSGVGDVDGDGVSDVLIGASYDGKGGDRTGAALMFFLKRDGTPKRIVRYGVDTEALAPELQEGDEFGQAMCPLGDFNGDGFPDVAVGARFDDDGGNGVGAVYLLYLADGVQPMLRADFGADRTAGAAPLTVAFRDESLGGVTSWLWELGDGATSTLAAPTHVYAADGTYDVTLTVANADGEVHTETKAGFVVVRGETVERYGCGVNPAGSLDLLSGTPSPGSTLVFGIESPFADSPTPGSTSGVALAFDPDPAYPCGTLVPGAGLDGGDGERLISLTPPNPVRILNGTSWSPGVSGEVAFTVPASSALIGIRLYFQGFLLDGPVRAFTDALELTVQ